MSGDEGYTLVEMLAALAVIGLAFGGLTAGSHILLRQQRSATSDVATSESLAVAQTALDRVLGGVQSDDILIADARRIEIACQVGERCEARDGAGGDILDVAREGRQQVAVVAAPGYRFSYWTAVGPASMWAAEGRNRLSAITLITDKARSAPLAVLRLREDQAFRCEYDVIIAACREATP